MIDYTELKLGTKTGLSFAFVHHNQRKGQISSEPCVKAPETSHGPQGKEGHVDTMHEFDMEVPEDCLYLEVKIQGDREPGQSKNPRQL